MSYCRFIEADVYIYMDVGGWLTCCACPLRDTWFKAWDTQSMLDHIAEHRKAGHYVPASVDDELVADDEENFPNNPMKEKEIR